MNTVNFNDPKIIEIACEALKNSGLIAAPSDTVFGLLADASDAAAIDKLIQIKSRPAGKPISIFVSDFEMMKKYVDLSGKEEILRKILPGKYTIVLPSLHKVDKRLESETGTLGVRFISNQLVNNLVKAYGKPITATSANVSGKSSCYSLVAFISQLSDKKKHYLDLCIDAGDLPHNDPSTVIDYSNESAPILRAGSGAINLWKSFECKSVDETSGAASELAKLLDKNSDKSKPQVVLLEGNLGAGKTHFAKGMGSYFGIHDIISPTYVVRYDYAIKNNDERFSDLIHCDLYNLSTSAELEAVGIHAPLDPSSLYLFEWSGIIDHNKTGLFKNCDVYIVQIQLKPSEGENYRSINVIRGTV